MRLILLASFLFQAAFDAASIKLSDAPNGSSSGITTKPGFISARNVTLRRCIRGAYNLPEAQVVGGPKWIDDLRYNIDAKAIGPAGDDDLMLMLQTLMADRFHLKLHRETRQINGYALVVAKTGFKAKPLAEEGECSESANTGGTVSRIDSKSCSIGALSAKLAEALHLPVADATGIQGQFSFRVEWYRDDSSDGPALGTVLNDQLGLKLEARKVPTPMIVIDSAEPATAN